MNRRRTNRTRQKQINILHTTARKRHSQRQVTQIAGWVALVLVMIVVVGVAFRVGLGLLLDYALYDNPHYTLQKIDIEPEGHFTVHAIRQATGLETGQNLWSLNLPRIAKDLETLPYVSNAQVERHFPDRMTIIIHERVPVVKIVGLSVDLGTRETFYLDRDCVVLKPRDDEQVSQLPEVVGLPNGLELEPGVRLDQPGLRGALEILDAIKHSSQLNTSIDIRSIDLSQPLSITMTTTQQTAITFRLDCIDQQLQRLQQILERFGADQPALRTVDLTPDRYVPVTFYE
ncbi:MAG: FtsQ-type POTRA domain-containing protein [Methylacidiphilales bacterium]|nr:FtsQ-type POTRA domain-containing protein [Candidatus Methylacidiphilales bacterium]